MLSLVSVTAPLYVCPSTVFTTPAPSAVVPLTVRYCRSFGVPTTFWNAAFPVIARKLFPALPSIVPANVATLAMTFVSFWSVTLSP